MKVLQLGCGPHKHPDAIGVDINPRSAADVICDLDAVPYPFASNSFDLILCEHILEHLNDVIQTMNELHRICKPQGRILVEAPHYASTYAFRDPTHKHFFSVHSFDYFVEGTPVYQFRYSDVQFRLLRVEFPPPTQAGFLKRFVFKLINRHIDWYERHLAFIFPRHLLRFELMVVK